MLKTISGHQLCAGIKDYLEFGSAKDVAGAARSRGIEGYLSHGHDAVRSQVVAQATVGLSPRQEKNGAWHMDRTREGFGSDTRTGRGREVVAARHRTYYHFILSPDPLYAIGTDDLIAYSKDWIEGSFGQGAQAAIVIHDDNANRIPHAHIVLSAVNKDAGRKWHFGHADVRRQASVVEGLAYKYSLDPLPCLVLSPDKKSNMPEYEPSRTADAVLTKAEIGMMSIGKFCWKEHIRQKARAASRDTLCFGDFERELAKYAITVAKTKGGSPTYGFDDRGDAAVQQRTEARDRFLDELPERPVQAQRPQCGCVREGGPEGQGRRQGGEHRVRAPPLEHDSVGRIQRRPRALPPKSGEPLPAQRQRAGARARRRATRRGPGRRVRQGGHLCQRRQGPDRPGL